MAVTASARLAVLVAAAALVAAACAPSPAAAPTSAPAAAAKPAETAAAPAATTAPASAAPTTAAKPASTEKVIFTTDFGFNGRHSYYFVALEKGFYKDAGFDVDIVKGNGSADAIKQVAAGKADYGFADAGTLVLSRGNENTPVKELAIVYNRNPQALYCSEKSGVKTPKDLEGKTLGAPGGSAVRALFPVFAQAAGIDANKAQWITADSSSLPSLLAAGQVDCIEQFTVGRYLLEKRLAPQKLTEIAYAASGLDLYGNGIVASDDTIKNKPDAVKRFVAASLKGLQYSIDHPDEAAQILNKYHPEIDIDIGKAETEAVKDLAVTPETQKNGLGYVDPARMKKTIDVVAQGLHPTTTPSVDDLYAPGFVPKS